MERSQMSLIDEALGLSEQGIFYLEGALNKRRFLFETFRVANVVLHNMEKLNSGIEFSVFETPNEAYNSGTGLVEFLKSNECSHEVFESLDNEKWQQYWNRLGSFFERSKEYLEATS